MREEVLSTQGVDTMTGGTPSPEGLRAEEAGPNQGEDGAGHSWLREG